jgi:hypothetical protein
MIGRPIDPSANDRPCCIAPRDGAPRAANPQAKSSPKLFGRSAHHGRSPEPRNLRTDLPNTGAPCPICPTSFHHHCRRSASHRRRLVADSAPCRADSAPRAPRDSAHACKSISRPTKALAPWRRHGPAAVLGARRVPLACMRSRVGGVDRGAGESGEEAWRKKGS